MKLNFMAKGIKRKQTIDEKNDIKIEMSCEEHNSNYKNYERKEKSGIAKSKSQANQSNQSRRSHQTFYVKSPTILEKDEEKHANKLHRNRKSKPQKNKSNQKRDVKLKNMDQPVETRKGRQISSNDKEKNTVSERAEDMIETSEECLDETFSSQGISPSSALSEFVTTTNTSTKDSSSKENSASNQKATLKKTSLVPKKQMKKTRKSIITLTNTKGEQNLPTNIQVYSGETSKQAKYRKHRKFSIRNSIYELWRKSSVSDKLQKDVQKPAYEDPGEDQNLEDVSVATTSSNAQYQNYQRFSIRNSMYDVRDESLETDSETKEVYKPVDAADSKDAMSNTDMSKDCIDYNTIDASKTSTSSAQETRARCHSYRKFSMRNSMYDVIDETLGSDLKETAYDKEGLVDLTKEDHHYDTKAVVSSAYVSSGQETRAHCQSYRKFSMRNSMYDVIDESLDSDGQTNEKGTINAAHDDKHGPKVIQGLTALSKDSYDNGKTSSSVIISSGQETRAHCQSYRKFSMRNSMFDVINESLDSDNKQSESEKNLFQAKKGKKDTEKQRESEIKRTSIRQTIGLLCAQRYQNIENKKEKRPIKVRMFNYTSKFEEQYISNYSKRLLNERKQSQACLRRLLKGPKRGNIFDTVSDNAKRLFRFHLPLSFYHGVEED